MTFEQWCDNNKEICGATVNYHWIKAAFIAGVESQKHRTISIECYVTGCKHCHEDLYCKNPHCMSIQICDLGVPQCEGYKNSEI